MDKDDLGRESIGNNISLQNNFEQTEKNSLNVSLQESIGEKILCRLKKMEAFSTAPEDIGDLNKLLEYYENTEIIDEANEKYMLKDLEAPYTVNAANI